jgi:SAM-dependent methyltransferase
MSASRKPIVLQKQRTHFQEPDWNPESSHSKTSAAPPNLDALELTPEMKARAEFIQELVANGGPEVRQYDQVSAWLDSLEADLRSGNGGSAYLQWLLSLFGEALTSKTMQGRSFTKPRGYHGDFEMIDHIYRESVSEDAKLSRWDDYFHAQAAPRAVRNRKAYFHDLLSSHVSVRSEPLRVLNVASGPARDVREWIDRSGTESVRFDCVELDSNAIAYALNLCAPYTDAVHFYLANALRFNTATRYDLVWSAGLFDYLKDRLFVRLLKRLMRFAKPGAEVVIGNFSMVNPSRSYMELVGGWKLLHRSDDHLRDLALQAGAEPGQIRIGAEPEGVNLFLHITSA